MFDFKDLLKAGIHFGHNTSRWNPKMSSFIWGARNKVHLIDVSKTAFLLERAGKYLTEVTSNGKSVLWVGTKKAAQKSVLKAAADCEMPSVIHRWIGGSLSNYDQVKKAVTRLLHLRDVVKKSLDVYGKKEQSMITKEVARLEKNVGGIIDLDYPPAAVIVVDARRERSAVKEALNLGIPVIAIVDTNTDPTGIPFVIPANDDSPRSIQFVLNHLSVCVQEGVKASKAAKAAKDKEKAEAKAAAAKAKSEKKPSPSASADAKAMANKKATEDEAAKKLRTKEKTAEESTAKPTEKKAAADKGEKPAKKASSSPKAETEKKTVEAKPKKEVVKKASAPKKAPVKEKKEAPKKETAAKASA